MGVVAIAVTIEQVRGLATQLPRSYEALVRDRVKFRVTFLLPKPPDQRYNWIVVRLDRIGGDDMREIVIDAWRMVVPTSVARSYLGET